MRVVVLWTNEVAKPCIDALRAHAGVEVDVWHTSHPMIPGLGRVWVPVQGEYDLGLSLLNERVLSEDCVNAPRLGWVNLHPAPLPRIGGRNACYHAIRLAHEEGDWRYGVTLHYMTKDVDVGGIIDVLEFPICREDTAYSLYSRAMTQVLPLFERNFPLLLSGAGRLPTIVGQVGQTNKVYHSSEIEHEVGLSGPEGKVLNRIRALTFPGKPKPYTMIQGRKVALELA